MKEEPRL
jgi:hypothetical protein